MKIMAFNISDDQYNCLSDIQKKTKLGYSKIIREILDEYFNLKKSLKEILHDNN